jgi:hypothetical protein
MKHALFFYIICCVSATQAMNKQLVGIVKPKQISDNKRENERDHMKIILNSLNVALYYHGLARKELSALLDKKNAMIIQTSQLEKSNMSTIHLAKVLELQKKMVASNEFLLTKQVEAMIVDTVDAYCNIAFTVQPLETTPVSFESISIKNPHSKKYGLY